MPFLAILLSCNANADASLALDAYSKCVDERTDFYLVSGDSADSIAVAAMYDCEPKKAKVRQELLKQYMDRTPNTPVANLVEGEIMSIDNTMHQTSIKRTLNNKIRLNLKSKSKYPSL